MKSIKQQFKDFRSSTPKHIQWLLLGAAFVVVIILLVLIIGGKSTKKTEIPESDQQASFSVTPDKIDLSGTVAGETKNESLTVTVNMPVVIDKIKSDISEITTTDNCDDLTDTCLINVIYKPTKPQDNKETTLDITWHVAAQKDIVNKQSITVVYGAIEDSDPFMEEPEVKEDIKPAQKPEVKEEKKPEPVEEEKPEPKAEPKEEKKEEAPVAEVSDDVTEESEEDDEESDETSEEKSDDTTKESDNEEESDDEDEEEEESEPVKEQIKKEIDVIAPKQVFKEPDPEPEFQLPPEKCSDFAIPGYDKSGVQIGWIKPENGANYFHPFSDKDCSNPTGKYDFKTGVITSLEDGSRMGTDADHIGYRNIRTRNMSVPQLSSPETKSLPSDGVFSEDGGWDWSGGEMKFASDDEGWSSTLDEEALTGSGMVGGEAVVSSRAFDRTFVLRQFKPIPATIVSEVRADPSVYGCSTTSSGQCDSSKNHSIPVRATVDRNVYSDDGRTVIIPTGTLLMGYLEGDLPGPYQAVGRMNIKWYQFILPNGVEFNFEDGQDPYSGDAQGRVGVPGHGSTDYMEQMVMPILTSLVPAAVNMIAPIADTVVNQINLDSNTVVQSGTMRSSEMAKQTIIDTWNKVAQKLLVDVMSNTTPPFSIAAGTRINVFSPVDLIVSCAEQPGKKCSVISLGNNKRRPWDSLKNVSREASDPSWVGQSRSFNLGDKFCDDDPKTGRKTIGSNWAESGYDYRTVYMYCESLNYESINMVKNKVYAEQTQAKFDETYGGADRSGDQLKAYNEDILGLKYNDDGDIINPWAKPVKEIIPEEEGLKCEDGTSPDADGCCAGETFTDMGEDGWNCCPDSGGDCFPPLTVEME